MIKPIKYLTLFLTINLLLFSCQLTDKNEYLFDASQLSHKKTPGEVIQLLGTDPDSAFNKTILGKERYIQLYYTYDSSEFRFAKNQLLEIIIHKPKFSFAPEKITEFGLPFRSATNVDSTAFIIWDNVYQYFEVINFYLVGSRNDNRTKRYKIYFKTKQPVR